MTTPPLPLGAFTAGTRRGPDVARLTLSAAALAPVPDLPAAAPVEMSGLVVPYGPTVHRFGTELVFEAGCLELPDDLSTVKLLIQHDDDRPAGYATAATETDAGLRMTFQLADHPRAAELAGEVAGKLRDGLSVGVEPRTEVMDAIVDRFWGDSDGDGPVVFAGKLREVSAVSVPALNDARTDPLAAAAGVVTFTTERTAMPAPAATATTDPPAPTPSTVVYGQVLEAPPQPTLTELADAVRELLGGQVADNAHPLARFASFQDYAEAVRTDPQLQLALVDQITTDNPGLVQPTWLSEIIGIIDEGSPVATGLTAGNLPASGMEINWPTYTGDLKTLVAKQETEKTGIHSEKVSIGKGGPAEIETFAGGSDISYQLLKRSSPSYRDAYNRIMALAYAWCTEAVVSAYLVEAAGGYQAWDPAAGTAAAFRSALFGASSQVRRATGTPANRVFVAPDVFERLGGLEGLQTPKYGTQNVPGTADASTLQIDVNSLAITEAPAFADGQVIVTNLLGARYLKDGPYTVTAEDVEKLGQNVAIWGMGAFLPLRPAGIVLMAAAAPAVEAAPAKSGK